MKYPHANKPHFHCHARFHSKNRSSQIDQKFDLRARFRWTPEEKMFNVFEAKAGIGKTAAFRLSSIPMIARNPRRYHTTFGVSRSASAVFSAFIVATKPRQTWHTPHVVGVASALELLRTNSGEEATREVREKGSLVMAVTRCSLPFHQLQILTAMGCLSYPSRRHWSSSSRYCLVSVFGARGYVDIALVTVARQAQGDVSRSLVREMHEN